MSLPLSVLETVLHPQEELLVFTVPGEDKPTIVYPSQLKDLYIQTRMELNKCRKALESTSTKLSAIIAKEKQREICNTTGENTSTQSQTTGKKSRKSTKKTTTTQK